MRLRWMASAVTTLGLLAAFPLGGASAASQAAKTEQATLGGGCFWCLEAAFEQLRGVAAVESGYAGGRQAAPTYEQVCGGRTGHAEVVRITYDPRQIGYRDLLRAFFLIHDPTTKDRQGNDVGSQYRSIVLTHSPAQAEVAQAVIKELAPQLGKPITTEVRPLERFWRAEAYHQDYFAKHPDQPYCALVVAPKVEKLRHIFVDRLKK